MNKPMTIRDFVKMISGAVSSARVELLDWSATLTILLMVSIDNVGEDDHQSAKQFAEDLKEQATALYTKGLLAGVEQVDGDPEVLRSWTLSGLDALDEESEQAN